MALLIALGALTYLWIGFLIGYPYTKHFKPKSMSRPTTHMVAVFGWPYLLFIGAVLLTIWFVGTALRLIGCCFYGIDAFREVQNEWSPEWLRRLMQKHLTSYNLRRIAREHAQETKAAAR